MEETNKNYDWLFIRPEQRAKELQKEISEIIATNNNEEEPVKRELAELGQGVEYYDDSYLSDLISFIFSNENADIRDDVIELIKTFPYVKSISKSNQFLQIETDDGVIECASISELIRKSGKASGEDRQSKAIEMFCRSIECIQSRQSNCHDFSITAAEIFHYDFEKENQVVTGYPKYYVPENKYLHSWVELTIQGKIYVLDFTKNTVMDKQSYYRLLHIDENEIVSTVSSQDIVNDRRNFGGLIKMLDSKTYLTSRHEIIRDLDKNKHLFDNSDVDSGEER